MLIKTSIDFSEPMTLTDEEEKELEELDNYPIVFDEDCPPLTKEQMRNYLIAKLTRKKTEVV